tara:strand:+ start:3020 stop:3223 length:204 start_codon:yes stop_codon:yes gene_type:complete
MKLEGRVSPRFRCALEEFLARLYYNLFALGCKTHSVQAVRNTLNPRQNTLETRLVANVSETVMFTIG